MNQLKTVVTKDRLGIATMHFEYDAFGRRIRKLNGSYSVGNSVGRTTTERLLHP
ncbi:hypothetical protein BC2230_40290 [Burkholderia cepacia]